jgi:hypothetical protein
MLFGPEGGKQFRDPDLDGSQAVQPGVAGGADGDEEPRLAHARLPVMNVKEAGLPTAPALESVPDQDLFPVSAKVIPRMPAHPVALRTQAGDGGDSLAAGAKERLLPETGLYPDPQEAFSLTGEG